MSTEARTSARPCGINDWIALFRRIYLTQNYERSVHQLTLHLLEIAANLQKAALKRRDLDACRDVWLPKLFAWYCSLLSVLEISDIESHLWRKFPRACPFCLEDQCRCDPGAASSKRIITEKIQSLSEARSSEQPTTLTEWQLLFDQVYSQRTRGISLHAIDLDGAHKPGEVLLLLALLKLFEEISEFSEAIRLRSFYPDNLLNEAADVIASICGVSNVLPKAFGSESRIELDDVVWRRYSASCDTCHEPVCTCRERAVKERLSAAGVPEERKDSITGLFTRRQFDADLRRRFDAGDGRIALILFDCDDFKSINDTGGHLQGDAVLRYIGASLDRLAQGPCRSYRLGGDEFAVIMEDADPAEAQDFANRIHQTITSGLVPSIAEGPDYAVGLSMGVAFRLGGMESPDALYKQADELSYEAKRSGKNQVVFGSGPESPARDGLGAQPI
jgi:diguanylate cyclase (GGDEF)-like protein